jgi:hypothetical protein
MNEKFSAGSKRASALKLGMITAMALAATACSASPGGEGEGSAASELTVLHSLSTQDYALSPHGGSGGSPTDIACLPGDVAVGLYGSSEYEQNLARLDITLRRLITRVGLICAHLESDGGLTREYTTPTVGKQGDNFNASPEAFSLKCWNAALYGIRGRAGLFLDAIGPVCGPVRYGPSYPANTDSASTGNIANGDVVNGDPAAIAQVALSTTIAGGAGGTGFDDRCPANFVVNRLTVRSGSWVDNAQAHCSEVIYTKLLDPPPAPPPPPSAPYVPKRGGGMTFCPTCRGK